MSKDKFGFPEGNAFIIKFGKIEKKKLLEIISQLNEASSTNFTHPNYGDIRIKRIYLVTNSYFTNISKQQLNKSKLNKIQMVHILERNNFLELAKK